jgi:uncharacterized membrane protein YfcA
MTALTVVLGGLIGILLGMLGGGGAILAVPVLVYITGIEARDAVGMSLAIVGTASVVGALTHRRSGNLDVGIAAIVGGAGLLGAFFGARLTSLVSDTVLMSAFAALMLAAGAAMLRRSAPEGPEGGRPQRPHVVKLLLIGLLIGGLTGFLGVGGGFLIVPALMLLAGLPMRLCTGTSLAIIAINSVAGFIGHLGEGDLHLPLTAVLIVVALAGVLVGERLAHRIPPSSLRRGFALFVITIGLLIAVKNLTTVV